LQRFNAVKQHQVDQMAASGTYRQQREDGLASL
jgi:hypothetical protein